MPQRCPFPFPFPARVLRMAFLLLWHFPVLRPSIPPPLSPSGTPSHHPSLILPSILASVHIPACSLYTTIFFERTGNVCDLLFWSISLSLQDLPTNPCYCTFGPVPNVYIR